MLLDPFEEELHLPTAPIEIGDGDRREGKVVGQKHQCFVLFGIEVADTAQFFWEVFLRIMPFEDNNLVSLNPCSSVHRPGIEAPSAELNIKTSSSSLLPWRIRPIWPSPLSSRFAATASRATSPP